MTIPTPTERIAEATRFLTLIMEPGAVHELRADTKAGFISGRYTDPVKMAQHGIALQEKYGLTAIYYGLNAAKPEAKFGPELPNTIQRRPSKGGAAKDSSIAHRSLYAIDIDSVREKGTMATDDQHLETVALAHRVINLMRSYVPDFPQPLWIHSGNGTHLLWRGDHCAADSPAWRYCLKRLAAEVASPGAAVDTTVYNASRILRLPGSINRKGPDTPDASHRMVKVTRYPAKWVAVEHGSHIYRLARALGMGTEEERQQQSGNGIEGSESMVMDLIHEYPEMLSFAGASESDEKTTIVIHTCPFVGRRHENGNSAFLVYRDGAVRYKCFAESCPGRGFGSLLRLLRERTGRESEVFRADRPLTERELELWGDIEEAPLYFEADAVEAASTQTETTTDATQEPVSMSTEPEAPEPTLSPAEAEFVAAWVAQDPRSIPGTVKAIDRSQSPLPLNPETWGLTVADIRETYRRRVVRDMDRISDPVEREEFRLKHLRIMAAADLREMGRHLGHYWLATIARNKQTRPAIDPDHIMTADEMLAIIAAG
jgi:hypothetical protein